jgi:hypothetical protein
MTRAFDRRVDRLHRRYIGEAGPDPSTLSQRDRAILEWKRWDLVVLTPEGFKRASELSEQEWREIEYHPEQDPPSTMTFVMPGTPLPAPVPTPSASSPVVAERPAAAVAAPEPAELPPSPPASPPPFTGPEPVPYSGGCVRWVPRHEADAMRERDYRDYLMRQYRERLPSWRRRD